MPCSGYSKRSDRIFWWYGWLRNDRQSMINVKSGGRTRIAGISAAVFLCFLFSLEAQSSNKFL